MNSNYWKPLGITIVGTLCLIASIYLSKDLAPQSSLPIQGDEMSQVKISVSIDDAHFTQIDRIAKELESSGMNVEETLSAIGVVSGSIKADELESLYKIEGVNGVEQQGTYQLAPPDSEVQ